MQETENGMQYTELYDAKSRSCILKLYFYVHRNAEAAPVHALITDLLTSASQAYPSVAEMSMRLDTLYAADFSGELTLCGDDAVLIFSAAWLDDRFALENEPVTDGVLDLVLGALFRPFAENGAFCDPIFRICKQSLLYEISGAQNNKRSYALQRASEIFFCDEPAAIPLTGTYEAVERVTPETAYRAWQEILRTAFIDIVCVTPAPKPQIAARIRAAFGGIRREPIRLCLRAPSSRKAEPVRVTEQMDVEQSKLILAYKYDSDIPAEVLEMLKALLSDSPDSLLFQNVREKRGLCYYCSLRVDRLKRTVYIESGVSAKQLQETEAAVSAQIDALRNGGFTDEMMEEAILQYEYRSAAATDTVNGIAAAAAAQHVFDDPRSMQEIAEAMRRVTRADIAAAAAKLMPDTVYILRPSDGEEVSSCRQRSSV